VTITETKVPHCGLQNVQQQTIQWVSIADSKGYSHSPILHYGVKHNQPCHQLNRTRHPVSNKFMGALRVSGANELCTACTCGHGESTTTTSATTAE
jgi:hypothetical protein